MSVDTRIREGLIMIEQQLPDVDAQSAYHAISREIVRKDRRTATLLATAAAAVILAGATAITLVQRGDDDQVQPAPQPPTGLVVVADDYGRLSFLEAGGRGRMTEAMMGERVNHFALSPDGTKVVFDGWGPWGKRGLWIVNSDGTNPEQVNLGCGCLSGWGVDWSHDGTRLAYVTSAVDQPWTIRVRTIATGAELSFNMQGEGVVSDVAFSPDDEQLAFTVGSGNVRVGTLDIGEGLASLRHLGPTHRSVRAPAWSEDGQAIFYTASDVEREQPDVPCCLEYSDLELLRVSDVYAVDAAGDERQITHAALGERYYTVHSYGDWFLTTHAVGRFDSTDMVIGWLSQDGEHFEPMLDPDGLPVTGSSAELQP